MVRVVRRPGGPQALEDLRGLHLDVADVVLDLLDVLLRTRAAADG